MSSPSNCQPALNKAMREAVDFIHSEGWDAAPTLFALVPTDLVSAQLDDLGSPDESPLTLIVQDNLPQNLEPGSEELADYVSRLAWPHDVVGVVLAQEIKFRDAAAAPDAPARPARLYSGVLREEGVELTLLQLRPTEEELEAAGPFAQDNIQLHGGPDVAPGVLAALRYGLEQDPDAVV